MSIFQNSFGIPQGALPFQLHVLHLVSVPQFTENWVREAQHIDSAVSTSSGIADGAAVNTGIKENTTMFLHMRNLSTKDNVYFLQHCKQAMSSGIALIGYQIPIKPLSIPPPQQNKEIRWKCSWLKKDRKLLCTKTLAGED